jgi:hypothetical protein
MPIKVENFSTIKPRVDLEAIINQIFDTVPKEHTRGITKVVIVDEIKDPRLQALTSQSQPVLYHPKTPGSSAFIEIGLGVFLSKKENFIKRLANRLNLKANLVGAILASIGQHYHLTYSHSIKKARYEAPVRAYVEKYFIVWRERNGGWRTRFFKPLHPYMERLDKWMRRKVLEQKKTAK